VLFAAALAVELRLRKVPEPVLLLASAAIGIALHRA